MLVKFKSLKLEVGVDIVANWHEIQTELFIKELQKQNRKKSIIDIILKDRQLVEDCLNKKDSELIAEIEAMQTVFIDYDRRALSKTSLPFIIKPN